MKEKILISIIVVVLSTLCLSGCTDLFNSDGSVVYESYPTKISYAISYGYRISCLGFGEHTIKYDCDVPEVLRGTTSNIMVLDSNYEDIEENVKIDPFVYLEI